MASFWYDIFMEIPNHRFETDKPSPEVLVQKAKKEIFDKLHEELKKNGKFYPARKDSRAEYVMIVPDHLFFSIKVAEADYEALTELEGYEYQYPARRSVSYWFKADSIQVQHQQDINEDPSGDPEYVDLDQKHEIDPEELILLRDKVLGSDR